MMNNKILLQKRTRSKTIAMAIAIGIFMLPTSTVSTKANDVGAELRHAVECLGLLFSDPALHLEVCGVSNTKVVNFDLVQHGSGQPPAVVEEGPVQEEPVQEEPVQEEPSPE